jgi:hypothetical protein
MNIEDKLASSLGHRDEGPNQKLAKEIASKKDKKAIQELVALLSNKNKDIQNDCIKVLYEIGELQPALISKYAKEFLSLLSNQNNRLQWGAMTALNTITLEDSKTIYASLSKIMKASDNGSVITKDHAVNILIKLCSVKQYQNKAFALLIEQLLTSPTNQLPMYAERAIPVVDDKNKGAFIRALTSRLDDIEKESKRKRVEKVIRMAIKPSDLYNEQT